MKVLCNLYPLGLGVYEKKARTGVYRVVEQLARGLSAAPGCETSFHALGDLWQSWRYYDEHLRGPHTRFVTSPWRVRASRHLASLERLIARTTPDRRLHLRAARFAARRYVRTAGRMLERVDQRVLAQTDVYHSPFLPIPAPIKRSPHLRRFTTVYDLIAITHPQFFNANVARMIRTLVDGLGEQDYAVCISLATRVALLEHAPRLDPARVFVIPLAAGPAFHPETDAGKIAAVRARIGLPPSAPYFLSLCTLEPRKNLGSVIQAFARLKHDEQIDRETRLVLVGHLGWKTESIFSALEEARDCRDSILLTGFAPDEELAALYSGARAFVYMSWLEGFGLPPLEAMQCGVPVICSNTSSLPEVVGDAGILVAPDDLDGIAHAMRTLTLSETRRRELAARAVERARLFSWEAFVRQTLDAYGAALATQR